MTTKAKRKPVVEPLYLKVGQRIRFMREIRGLSQDDLGRACHPTLGRAAVANMESGKQRIMLHNIYDFAAMLRFSVCEVLGERRKP